ncbi:MAG: WecB/TagA/CpsF family glycosyltransferase [Candidatus Omnitrophica bacterium]|nr:WecB/TagA/CpsF family glycosyltransferase [Candidatus Omnitrophota bacterium]
MKTLSLLGIPFNTIDIEEALKAAEGRIRDKKPNYICFISTHPAVEAYFNKDYRAVLHKASLVLPDGMPIVWAARIFGQKIKNRVYGPDFMLKLLELSEKKGYSNFFYGGKSDEALKKLLSNIKASFPHLKIVGSYNPPFYELNKKEDELILQKIRASNPDILWIGLGGLKKDYWMYRHKESLPGVLQLGVGAAFDFHAGIVKQAPNWMQHNGLEWLFRLIQEPKRLWKRYLKCVPLFIVLVFMQYFNIIKSEKNERN